MDDEPYGIVTTKDGKFAYVTLSDKGDLGVLKWPEPGLKLNFNA